MIMGFAEFGQNIIRGNGSLRKRNGKKYRSERFTNPPLLTDDETLEKQAELEKMMARANKKRNYKEFKDFVYPMIFGLVLFFILYTIL